MHIPTFVIDAGEDTVEELGAARAGLAACLSAVARSYADLVLPYDFGRSVPANRRAWRADLARRADAIRLPLRQRLPTPPEPSGIDMGALADLVLDAYLDAVSRGGTRENGWKPQEPYHGSSGDSSEPKHT